MSETVSLSFEKSVKGRYTDVVSPSDAPAYTLPQAFRRKAAPVLPELSEVDVDRHYTQLAHRAYGVNCGFYPLGSCTMA